MLFTIEELLSVPFLVLGPHLHHYHLFLWELPIGVWICHWYVVLFSNPACPRFILVYAANVLALALLVVLAVGFPELIIAVPFTSAISIFLVFPGNVRIHYISLLFFFFLSGTRIFIYHSSHFIDLFAPILTVVRKF